MTSEDIRIIEAMKRFGGDFIRSIAEAAQRADDHNLARLKAAFASEWARYLDMAERAGIR